MRAAVRLMVIPGATHLFEEPGALEQVAAAARDWFVVYLAGDRLSASKVRERGMVNVAEERRP
jgi:putative phosphoribosyl transferase